MDSMRAPRLAAPPGVPPSACLEGILGVDDGVEGMLRTLVATGSELGSAMTAVLDVHGLDGFRKAWSALSADGVPDGSGSLVVALDAVARLDPASANAFLNDGLSSGLIAAWGEHEADEPPEDAVFGITLKGREWVKTLPDGFEVRQGSLDLSGCRQLQALPRGLKVPHGVLHLQDCVSLGSLPDDLQVQSINADGCTSLQVLPTGLHIPFLLVLSRCPRLEELPDDLTVGGWLQLEGCTALRRLPKGLQVGNSLNLGGCAAWDGHMPQDAIVGGKLFTDAYRHGVPLEAFRSSR